jgi:hypothetical protein
VIVFASTQWMLTGVSLWRGRLEGCMKVILEKLESDDCDEITTELGRAMRSSAFTAKYLVARLCAHFFASSESDWDHRDYGQLAERLRLTVEAFQDEIDARRPTSPPPLE